MDLTFMTPREVWRDYDPTAAPLESSMISVEKDGNIVKAAHCFTAESGEGGRIRAYAEVYYDNRWADKRATVLILPDIKQTDVKDVVRTFLGEGYVVCVADYCGAGDGESGTSFPADAAFAAYPACLDGLDSIGGSAHDTPWYVWNKLVRRLITLLCAQTIVETSRIALLGIGVGADIAWQVAGMDRRVHALIAICGGGYRWARSKPRFVYGNVPSSDEEIAYSTGVGAESYAKYVSVPTLYIASKNGTTCDPDRAGDIIGVVSGSVKQLVISESAQHQISASAFETLLVWLRNNLVMGMEYGVLPTLRFEASDGRLCVHCSSVRPATSASLWMSFGETDPSNRHWTPVGSMHSTGESDYIATPDVIDAKQIAFAYATFTYDDGTIASTPIQATLPAKLGATKQTDAKESARIIYDGNMGTGAFLAYTDDVVLADDVLGCAKGPFGIRGITAKRGTLLICRSACESPVLRGKPALHFDAYSPARRTVTVSVYTTDAERKEYTARKTLSGGEFWQKLLFEPSDFKSEEGRSLMRFSDTKTLAIADVDGAIFNNFIWI